MEEVLEEVLATTLPPAIPATPMTPSRTRRVLPDPMKLSLTEDDKVKTHMGATCGCKLYGGKPYSKQFSLTHVLEIRMSAMDLTASELDVAACTNQSTNQSEDVVVESRHLATERINAYSRYTHQGKRVCPYMFGFLNTVGMFRNLKVNKRRNT